MTKKTTPLLLLALFLCLSTLQAQIPGSGNCLDFSINKSINIPHNAALNFSGGFSLEAWIKADSWHASQWGNSIISKDGWGGGEKGFALRCGNNGRLSFLYGTNPGWREVFSAQLMKLNTWYHVAGTFNGSVLRIYINGEQVATLNSTPAIVNSTFPLRIGNFAYTSGGNRPFDGQIDEVRIWKTALSATEIRTWMCKRLNATHPQDTNLQGYWRFDEGTGTTVADLSGNGLTGSFLNGPSWVTSGAALGDESVYTYTPTSGLILPGLNGDSIIVSNVTGSPKTIHIYYIPSPPNVITPPSSITRLDTTTYIGVFVGGGTNPTYNFAYRYDGNPVITSATECKLKLVGRPNNAATTWTDLNATLDLTQKEIRIASQSAQEYILGFGSGLATIAQMGPASFCMGDSSLLIAPNAPNVTHQWLLNGMALTGAIDSSLAATQDGNYQVIVSTGGCADTSSVTTLQVFTLPMVSMAASLPVCENGTPVSLSGLPAGGSFSGSGVTGSTFNAGVAGAGVHHLTYSYTDMNGCTNSAVDSILVHPEPVVSFNFPKDHCESAPPVTLSGGSPTGGTYTGTGVSGGMFDPQVAGPGTRVLTYTYTDMNGCTGLATSNVVVHPVPMVSLAGFSGVCEGTASFQLQGGQPAGGTYKGPGVVTGAFFDATMAGVGNHSITYVFTTTIGCADSATQVLPVTAKPNVTLAPFDSICDGHPPITLSGGMPAGGSYAGPAVSNGVFDPDLLAPGTFNITYQYTDALGCSDFTTQSITINFTPPKPTVTQFGSALVSSASSGNQWYNSSNVAIPGATGKQFQPLANASYYVIVTTPEGCESEPSDLFAVMNVGLEDLAVLQAIDLFPNPNSGTFTLQFSSQPLHDLQLDVMDEVGRTVFSRTFARPEMKDQLTIVLPTVASGVYFVKLTDKKESILRKMVIFH